MSILIKACAIALSLQGAAAAQTMVALKHQAPDGAGAGFLLTDGTALFQGNAGSDWYRLTPDNTGSYQNGIWSRAANLPAGYAPLYFASAVLADGRVLIAGGEYNNGVFAFTDRCAIYDPVTDTWKAVAPPAGWGFIGDAPSALLPDGHFLLGRKFDTRMAALDPATLAWTEVGATGKNDIDAEEGWTLLPNGHVFTYDVKAAPHAEFYDPTTAKWASAGQTPALLKGPPYVKIVRYGNGQIYHPPGEVGPGLLLPDGTVFATGATPKGGTLGHTALYHPPVGTGPHASKAGTWTAGPDFPPGVDAGDSAAALLPTGNVLVRGNDDILYEFDGIHLTASPFSGTTYGSLFILPTGEAIVSGATLYRPAGKVNHAWAPIVDTYPASAKRGTTYLIAGRQFNGLSQAASFGDEVETATNYPLVRLSNVTSGHVIYARTHDHSTMAVATGTAAVSTHFDVPAAAEPGKSTLVVVANGIASAPVDVTIE